LILILKVKVPTPPGTIVKLVPRTAALVVLGVPAVDEAVAEVAGEPATKFAPAEKLDNKSEMVKALRLKPNAVEEVLVA
tara:strand:+ start:510 stop:746 length:237 start_codon:yes stop_codon:yes gene_type:complete